MTTRRRSLPLLITLAVTGLAWPLVGTPAAAADPTVVVTSGDTLSGLARRHGVPIEQLVAVNGLANPNRIYAGQVLRLVAEPPPAAAPAAGTTTHVVTTGETLIGIARRTGTTVAQLVAANTIANPSRIYAGQQLVMPVAASAVHLPAAASEPQAAAGTSIHVVAAGDTLIGIARRTGTTVSQLVAANTIANPSRIYAGQQLVIPPPAAEPPTTAELMAERDGVRQVIAEEAHRFGVPVELALALAWQESGWQQDVVSSAGAVGVMQLLPATGAWVGEAMLGEPVDIGDTRSNVRAGVRLLAHYLARYGGHELALAAYYQGQTAADRHGIYPVSRPYIASIEALTTLLGG